MPLFLIIYCLLTMVFTFGLLIYHTTLVWRDLTTKEELKGAFTNTFGNPYSRSCGTNLKKFLCPRLSKPDLLVKIKNKFLMKQKEQAEKEKNIVLPKEKETKKESEKQGTAIEKDFELNKSKDSKVLKGNKEPLQAKEPREENAEINAEEGKNYTNEAKENSYNTEEKQSEHSNEIIIKARNRASVAFDKSLEEDLKATTEKEINLANPESNTNTHSEKIEILKIPQLQLKNPEQQASAKEVLLARPAGNLPPNSNLIDSSLNSLDVNEEGHVNLDFQENNKTATQPNALYMLSNVHLNSDSNFTEASNLLNSNINNKDSKGENNYRLNKPNERNKENKTNFISHKEKNFSQETELRKKAEKLSEFRKRLNDFNHSNVISNNKNKENEDFTIEAGAIFSRNVSKSKFDYGSRKALNEDLKGIYEKSKSMDKESFEAEANGTYQNNQSDKAKDRSFLYSQDVKIEFEK